VKRPRTDRGTDAERDARVAELLRAEPRLAELLREVEATEDDGRSSWFCSNYVWLPLNTRLRLIVGVARTPQPGDAARAELYESRTYELVFGFLSQRMPPCRACGCRRFREVRASA